VTAAPSPRASSASGAHSGPGLGALCVRLGLLRLDQPAAQLRPDRGEHGGRGKADQAGQGDGEGLLSPGSPRRRARCRALERRIGRTRPTWPRSIRVAGSWCLPLCWGRPDGGPMPSAAVKPTAPPSSSGLGHRPFKAAARVRIPLGARAAGRWNYFFPSGLCADQEAARARPRCAGGLAQGDPISGPRGSEWPVGSFLPNGSSDSPWLRGSPTPPRFRFRRGEALVQA
jgi:hypothetical protein